MKLKQVINARLPDVEITLTAEEAGLLRQILGSICTEYGVFPGQRLSRTLFTSLSDLNYGPDYSLSAFEHKGHKISPTLTI